MEEQRMGLFVDGSEVPVPLSGVDVEIELSGMFAHTRVAQRYTNESGETIEVIYAFPVSTEGVLLGMEIVIAGKTLTGIVQTRNEAGKSYEGAVAGGNGAFLLQRLGNGLYQMNVGNLKPGEKAEIRIRYAEILRWSGNALRYRLPTVVAPRYGDPRTASISREDAPQTSLMADYPLSLEMAIKGALSRADITSPTHAIAVERAQSSTRIRLGKDASLDRDFILSIGMCERPAWEVMIAPDGEQYAALGCLNVPTLGAADKPGRRDITVVVDCSGSMNGDSIAQARNALLAILDELKEGDTISILRFGSSIDTWTPEPVVIDGKQREKLRRKITTLEADLGGTEILNAIGTALRIAKLGADILLITDGEAYVDEATLVRIASRSPRFFTVGVGASVSEGIVKTLAEASGGACELVTPNEHMAERIVAHARRMAMPRASLVVDWHAAEPVHMSCKGVVFAGDTLSVMAVLSRAPAGNPCVTLDTGESTFRHEVEAKAAEGALAEALPRIVAWHRLNEVKTAEEAAEIAVRYQLVSEHTSMVAVLERAEGDKTDGLPSLAEVPQMLAAGWGGVGVVEGFPYVEEVRMCQVSGFYIDYCAPNVSPCPKCGGIIRETYDMFQCIKCNYSLWKIVAGRQFEPEEVYELLSKGVVGPLQGFRSKMGRTFSAMIRLNAEHQPEFDFGQDGSVEGEAEVVDFSGQEPLGKCPKCGARVFEHGMAYVCEKAVGAAKACDFRSGKIIMQQPVERAQMAKLLFDGRTDLLRGFVSVRTKRKFSAYLVMGSDGRVGFEFEPRAPRTGARKTTEKTDKAPTKTGKAIARKTPAKKKTARN